VGVRRLQFIACAEVTRKLALFLMVRALQRPTARRVIRMRHQTTSRTISVASLLAFGLLAVPADARTRDVTIPAGTILPLQLDTAVASDRSRPEDPVRAHLRRAVHLAGEPVLPIGTPLRGSVLDATRSRRVKGRAHLSMRFDTLMVGDDRYAVRTGMLGR
jgi:hypothetical protein